MPPTSSETSLLLSRRNLILPLEPSSLAGTPILTLPVARTSWSLTWWTCVGAMAMGRLGVLSILSPLIQLLKGMVVRGHLLLNRRCIRRTDIRPLPLVVRPVTSTVIRVLMRGRLVQPLRMVRMVVLRTVRSPPPLGRVAAHRNIIAERQKLPRLLTLNPPLSSPTEQLARPIRVFLLIPLSRSGR